MLNRAILLVFRILSILNSIKICIKWYYGTNIHVLIAEEREKERETAEADENAIES